MSFEKLKVREVLVLHSLYNNFFFHFFLFPLHVCVVEIMQVSWFAICIHEMVIFRQCNAETRMGPQGKHSPKYLSEDKG